MICKSIHVTYHNNKEEKPYYHNNACMGNIWQYSTSVHNTNFQWTSCLKSFQFVQTVTQPNEKRLLSSIWERSVLIPIPKKGNAKECSNYHTIALVSHASKVMLRILQLWFQQCMNHELPDTPAGFIKDRGTRDQIANIYWIIKKAREFQKNIYFGFIDYAKAFHCLDHNKL